MRAFVNARFDIKDSDSLLFTSQEGKKENEDRQISFPKFFSTGEEIGQETIYPQRGPVPYR